MAVLLPDIMSSLLLNRLKKQQHRAWEVSRKQSKADSKYIIFLKEMVAKGWFVRYNKNENIGNKQ